MKFKFDVCTQVGSLNFFKYARTLMANGLFFAEPHHTGEDVANYVYEEAAEQPGGPRAYWNLLDGGDDDVLTNTDPDTERRALVAIADRALTELSSFVYSN